MLQVKYREKLKEDEKRNTDNWNGHFHKLKATFKKEQESNDMHNLLKYGDEESQDENVAANNKYMQKNTTRANITDLSTNFHESIKFI